MVNPADITLLKLVNNGSLHTVAELHESDMLKLVNNGSLHTVAELHESDMLKLVNNGSLHTVAELHESDISSVQIAITLMHLVQVKH